MKWEAIETAPKDVSNLQFLVWEDGFFDVVWSCEYIEDREGVRFYNGDVFVTATHWASLTGPTE